MDGIVENILQTFQTGANIIAHLASQAGYEIDATTIISTVVSIIALYFALLSLYRTIRYAIRTAIFIIKWILIIVIIAGSVGFVMSGGRAFTLLPVVNALFAYGLKMLGWGSLPQVEVGPAGLRVNGVKMELPEDFHQYGNAWKKFKRSSKRTNKVRSAFDSTNPKKSNQDPITDAAAIAQRLLVGNLGGMADAWQSVEVIQKGVADSFDALRSSLGLNEDVPEAVVEEDTASRKESIWADLRNWWENEAWKGLDEDEDEDKDATARTNSR
ncbi:hypothetical protein FRB95_012533 [Tulasnella sp. JGI-2019a]|nr:hypothetical protein FRB93_004345 [Tulasnella sp. JGI-2019a]KAG9034840.1 hypothetical protein FRB95_012533 [Tulasnella sp. JGI-2019a]